MKNRGTFIGILIILQLFISIPLTDASRQQISARKLNRYSQKRYPELNGPLHQKKNGKNKKRKKKTIQTTLEPVETTLEPIQTTLEVIQTTLDPPDCELKVYSEAGCNPSDFVWPGLERDDGESETDYSITPAEHTPSSVFFNKNSQTSFACEATVKVATLSGSLVDVYQILPSNIVGYCIEYYPVGDVITEIRLDMSVSLPP